MEVHTTHQTLVKPSVPTPTHLQEFRPSSLDQVMPNFFVQLLLHYRASDVGVVEKIHRLQKSLPEALSIFYHLAGRCGEAGDVINCNDQGVQFVEATVNGKLDQFMLDGGDNSYEMLLALPSSSAITPGCSLSFVAIKVTVFECGGLVVGVQMNHILADMFSICTFLNEWATASRGGNLQVVRADLQLPRLFPPKDLKNASGSPVMTNVQVLKAVSENTTLKRFSFKNEDLSRLRDEVTTALASSESDNGTNCMRRPSRVELLTALICKVVVSIDRVKYGRSRPMAMSHVVNLRGRTDLPIKENVFGNLCITTTSGPLMSNDYNDSELLHRLVQLVADTLRNAIIECGKVEDCMELSQKVEAYHIKGYGEMMKGETNVAMFSSWCKFPLYGVDYGWGRPALVRIGKSTIPNVFILMDAESGDGIDVWVTLEDDDMMNYFEQDPDIQKCIMSAQHEVGKSIRK